MAINKRRIAIIFFIIACLPFFAHAAAYKDLSSTTPYYLQNAEVSLGVGPTFYRVNKGHIVVTLIENDTAAPNSVFTTVAYRIGAGYYLFKSHFTPDSFFNSLLAELSLYHSNFTIKGQVLQSGQQDLINYNFKVPYSSTALMLDFKPGFLAYKKLSPYAIFGLGVAWNQISYKETLATPDVPANSIIALASRTKQNFAYDLGLGARYAFTKHISTSVEYIYTHLGNVIPSTTSSSSASNVSILIPPTFTVYNQTLFFNVIYNF